MIIDIITLFPEMFKIIKEYGVIKRSIVNKSIKINCLNLRNFSIYKKKVDDRPYGGGPGMLLLFQPIRDAIIFSKKKFKENLKVIYLSPKGKKLDQKKIFKLSKIKKIILVCGRYEGIDERVFDNDLIDEELSIGDYILTGGEIPAMVLIDSIVRLIPGVLGNSSSLINESFKNGILSHPSYTRPRNFNGSKVPKVLFSGNHLKINRWKRKNSLGHTWLKRPDLLKKFDLNSEDRKLLSEYKSDYKKFLKNRKLV